jgi:hypothetical protein
MIMAIYFDRYEQFKDNGQMKPIPGIKIPEAGSDKTVVYKLNDTRLDKLSQDYYNNPYHGFLIQIANPKYGGLEFDIPDRAVLRIPFPFESALERYNNEIKKHKALYG